MWGTLQSSKKHNPETVYHPTLNPNPNPHRASLHTTRGTLKDVEGDYSPKSQKEWSNQQSLCTYQTKEDCPLILKSLAFLTIRVLRTSSIAHAYETLTRNAVAHIHSRNKSIPEAGMTWVKCRRSLLGWGGVGGGNTAKAEENPRKWGLLPW